MSGDSAHMRPGTPLGQPHITMEHAATGDGRAFLDWQASTSFMSRNTLQDETDATAFNGSAHIYFLGRYVLLQSVASHPTRMVRMGVDIARSDVDLVQICLMTEGSVSGRSGERSFAAEPGDIVFINCSQPFDCALSAFRMIVLLVPRDALSPGLADYLVQGSVLAAGRPATAILSRLMAEAYANAPALTAAEAEAAAKAAVSLADDLCRADLSPGQSPSPASQDLLAGAQATIERLLEDPDLSAARLQKLLHVSRAALYELFAPNGGVQAYIRERRLQRCYEIFKSNQRPNDTIAAVAFSLGFRSEAHFSRAFKERFGLSPRVLRLESRKRSADLQPAIVPGITPHVLQTIGRGDGR